jgi:DNA-3-methyladenine glycosylase
VSARLRPLPRAWFRRPAPEVARDLLGRLLVGRGEDGVLVGRLVECEAYQQDDPASHSFRGRTRRTEVMFGPPGHLYVYFTYGMHHCMNVVTGRTGEGSAVLLRAVEPLEGLEVMRRRRGSVPDRLLCAGPGRLTQAFGVAAADNGLDLVGGERLFVAAGEPVSDDRVLVDRRVGIRHAAEIPWRFSEAGSAFVSIRRRAMPRGL